jgi:hypothetical protein
MDYDLQHLRNLGLTDRQIELVFETAAKEAAKLAMKVSEFNPERAFDFSDYPETRKLIAEQIRKLGRNIEAVITNSTSMAWLLANNKNNYLCDLVFGENKDSLTESQMKKYYSNNSEALKAFQTRKTAGMNLSDRVWNLSEQFRSEVESGIDAVVRETFKDKIEQKLAFGIGEGKSAANMAKDLKQFLVYPDKLFRRVRDEHGELHLSKAAKLFHPGRGVYRSSFRNARRLAATETNMAYRTSDHERWQQLDFVVGIEIHLSENHTLNGEPFTDICDDLKGRYPKEFKFTGWHPLCRCFATSILKTDDEFVRDARSRLEGEDVATLSENEVKDVPENFKKWIAENKDRILEAEKRGTLPYFIRDNSTFIEKVNNSIVSYFNCH